MYAFSFLQPRGKTLEFEDPYTEELQLDPDLQGAMGQCCQALRMYDRSDHALQMEGYLLDQYTRRFRFVSNMSRFMSWLNTCSKKNIEM